MKSIILVSISIFLTIGTSQAQFLEVRRSAVIRQEPIRNSSEIVRVKEGDYLKLLDNGKQENGYYNIETNDDENKKGWIYRTLVRRYEGNIPSPDSRPDFGLSYEPVPTNYYEGTKNINGDVLKEKLYEIIKDHREFSYGEIWDILKETDIDVNDSSRVLGIYSGFSMEAKDEYNGGKGWNREHVWAKSYGNFGTRIGAGTDVHHIRVEDVSTNSARNNRSFDECDTQYIDKSGNYKGETSSKKGSETWTWEPRDEVKGDVARMMFYMVVRYEGENGEPDLELIESIKDKNDKNPTHGKLSILLKWHQQDPVDDYEKYRNHIIYKKYQRNRNPFIDHPEYVTKIWGN